MTTLVARRRCLLLILALTGLGALLIAYGYWPGIMIDDARWQYQQAIDNSYEDWHPPLMAWAWRHMLAVATGPAPMFVLQLALYWTGIALMAGAACRRQRPRLAVLLALVGWLPAPLALMGTVTKDGLLAGLLASAAGLIFWRKDVSGAVRAVLSTAAIVLLLLAAALRFNAFLACLPLVLAAAPDSFTRSRARLLASGLGATIALLSTGPVVSALLQAEHTDVEFSLIIFDLGGITEHTGVSQFPDMHVPKPVAANHACYDPLQWDGYSSWAARPCPLVFERFQSTVADRDINPIGLWLGAIARHPLAYAAHRLTHFNLSTWFLVAHGPPFTAWSKSVDNPWGFQVRSNAVLKAADSLASLAARTPLGWPACWICVALAAFFAATRAGLPREELALAASPFLYGLGYLVFGVATGMRYHIWTLTGAALAAAVIGSEIARRRLPATKFKFEMALVVVPVAMATAMRLSAAL